MGTAITLFVLFALNINQYINYQDNLNNKPLPTIAQTSCCCGIHVVGNSTIVALMIYAKTELTVLNTCMRNLHLYSKTEDEILQNLRKLVIKHQRIITFVEKLSMMIRFAFLIDFCITAIVSATSVLQMVYLHTTLVGKLFQIFFVVSEWFQIFSVSWFANEIRIESTALSGALYETKWYNYSQRIKQLISIMMIRSQEPLTMHIGPFDVLTNNAVLRALRATYSYITLLLVMAPTEEN
ncbi:hypothetical protein ABEB36_013341 [Hypothenemus hampei]|uniref:Uncharacterized protein n=1 Tax=Hypothenemus hampei TaxID=57062 RepID=A0ABD1E7P2_HYPHA